VTDRTTEAKDDGLFGAERAKAFIDAVVAIAMTLLILPLMESVSEVAAKGEGAAQWLAGHGDQLFGFALSFVIIAVFWMAHHRVFSRVHLVSSPLLWITMGWLLTIVWLPVVTAMVGQMAGGDPLLTGMYIGSMLLTEVMSIATLFYLRAHPHMHDIGHERTMRWIAIALTMIVLFAVSLVVAVAFPAISYYALFLMFLTRPVDMVVARMLRVPRRARR
jgi:uncharacterized membrane protein